MARRPGIIVSEQTEVEPPNPPFATPYINRVSVQINVVAPPHADTAIILETLDQAHNEAITRILREM